MKNLDNDSAGFTYAVFAFTVEIRTDAPNAMLR